MKIIKKILSSLILLLYAQSSVGEIVVIGHRNVPKMDLITIKKIYMGKIISLESIKLKPVNTKSGSTERNQFLDVFIGKNEDKYTGYWTVRRYIGKGTSPNELNNATEIIDYVTSTAGAIGYIDSSLLTTKLNVIGRQK